MNGVGEEKQLLEVFDGSNPAMYRLWKRRAQLMVAALPNTIPKEKYGPRLMQYIKGEAEQLCEGITVSDLCAEGGDTKIFKLLDEKFGPLPMDMLQKALRTFFYELQVKPAETYQQFLARYASADRLLQEQKVELPSEVKGYMLIKKLKLDAASEAMILTATRGVMKFPEVCEAVKAIYPDGKGTASAKNKEIFLADGGPDPPEDEDEVLEAMEAVAEEWQLRDDVEDEDVLEAFESYSEIRRRMAEKRKARGFVGGGSEPQRWKLSGSVTGRIEMLKAKTRCHLCKRLGHWKRECPNLQRKGAGKAMAAKSNSSATSVGRGTEALVIEENDQGSADVYLAENAEAWQLLEKFRQKPIKHAAWTGRTAEAVQNSGFADTHATGNRQRPEDGVTVAGRACEKSPAQAILADYWEIDRGHSVLKRIHVVPRMSLFPIDSVPSNYQVANQRTTMIKFEDGNWQQIHDDGESRQKMGERWTGSTEFQLSTSTSTSEVLTADIGLTEDSSLAACGVPDTACRRTLVGAYTLTCIERLLARQGYQVRKVSESNQFRFGNSGVLSSDEVAILPASLGNRLFLVKAAILRGSGSATPLLLSKELMRHLGAVLDMSRDVCEFKNLGCTVKMVETKKGHYGIPLFNNFKSAERYVNHVQNTFDIDELEREVDQAPAVQDRTQAQQERVAGPPRASHVSPGAASEGVGQGEGDGERLREGRRHNAAWRVEESRQDGGQRPGRIEQPSGRQHAHGEGQVQRQAVHGGSVHLGQGVRGMGQKSCHAAVRGEHQKVADLRGIPRHGEVQQVVGGEGAPGKRRERVEDEDKCDDQLDDFLQSSGKKKIDEIRRHGAGKLGLGEDRQGDESEDAHEVEPVHQGATVQPAGQVHRTLPKVPEESEQCCSDTESPDSGLIKMNRKGRRRLQQATKRALQRAHDCYSCCKADLGCTADLENHGLKPDIGESDIFHVHLSQSKTDNEVSEVFSMPRIVPMAEKKGLKGGRSFDLANGWDFLRADHRKQCLKLIGESKPLMVVVSPPCVEFSSIQNLDRQQERDERDGRKKIEANMLLDFAMQVCQLQHDSGGLFVFEHPAFASSWTCESVYAISKLPGVQDVVLDQCMYGLRDPCNHKHYKKATRLMTNSRHVAEGMNRRCNGRHEHQTLQGQVKVAGQWCNRTKIAQVYPKEMVSCLLSCIRRARRERERVKCWLPKNLVCKTKDDLKRAFADVMST